MKKIFIFSLIVFLFFSCAKEEKDDSYKYLYDKLDGLLERDHNVAEGTYLQNYHKIKNDVSERKRYDSLHKISLDIDGKLRKIDFSDREKVIKFRDSTAKLFNYPIKFVNQDDGKKLNDSVFKKRIELEILNLREHFHYMYIYPRHEL